VAPRRAQAEPESALTSCSIARAELEADIAVVKRVQVAPREAAEAFARDPRRRRAAHRDRVEARAARSAGRRRGVVGLTAESPWRITSCTAT